MSMPNSTEIAITERLVLREFDQGDAQDLYFLNSDLDVLKYTGDKPFKSIQEARDFVLEYDDYKKNGLGRWAVVSKLDRSFLGWCGLKKHPEGFIDLGFRFSKLNWGKGFATE